MKAYILAGVCFVFGFVMLGVLVMHLAGSPQPPTPHAKPTPEASGGAPNSAKANTTSGGPMGVSPMGAGSVSTTSAAPSAVSLPPYAPAPAKPPDMPAPPALAGSPALGAQLPSAPGTSGTPSTPAVPPALPLPPSVAVPREAGQTPNAPGSIH